MGLIRSVLRTRRLRSDEPCGSSEPKWDSMTNRDILPKMACHEQVGPSVTRRLAEKEGLIRSAQSCGLACGAPSPLRYVEPNGSHLLFLTLFFNWRRRRDSNPLTVFLMLHVISLIVAYVLLVKPSKCYGVIRNAAFCG